MLWRELPFLDRFSAAKEAGFDTVEFWWPRGDRPEDVEAAVKRCDLKVAILNIDSGDLDKGDRGFLNRAECHGHILAAADEAIGLARSVGCGRMNSPVGKDSGLDREMQADAIVEVLKRMVEKAAPAGVLVTLEPLSLIDHPTYLLGSTDLATEWIKRVGPGVGLLYDAYHLGAMGDDIVLAARTLQPAYIQVADCPGRHEPGTGQLPFAAFFEAVQASGYRGSIGLEYAPLESTPASLERFQSYLKSHGFPTDLGSTNAEA
jgi:hydroxypyruvate isomerase